MFCNVIVTLPFDQVFTYKVKKDQLVEEGNIVSVPFGKKNNQIAMVVELMDFPRISKKYQIKEIETVYTNIILSKKIIKFTKWISNYTLSPIGLVLKLFLINKKIISNVDVKEKNNILNASNVKLNQDQKKVFDKINKFMSAENLLPIVLEGVTGSGKTEVFFEIVEKIIKKKQQVLIMVPEISLTPQLEQRFFIRFGFFPDIWHSKISELKRKNIWHRCYKGSPIIVIGARSSLFLPYKKLKLIVVDEEHDSTYKQEDNIRYQARDLAVVRAKIDKATLILSSATPSLETQNNINKKKYLHVFLPTQFSGIELPQIELIDMTKNHTNTNKWISHKILLELKKILDKSEQALLFLNRRGYSPLSLCVECGYRYQCQQCTSWLVLHNKKKRLLCHQCGLIYSIEKNCPKCSSKNSIKLIGPGVERLAEELELLFPEKKIHTMSSDNANTPKKIKKITDDFENKKIDILVATQIMTKGYHFPNLSFVGVIDADAGLFGGDIRAVEKTYNILQQVSGRAGRSNKKGRVFIQTYFPDQRVIASLQKRERKNFIEQTLKDRKLFNLPPFVFMTAIIISGSSKVKVHNYSKKLIVYQKNPSDIFIFGPVEAPIFLLRGKYRFRILIKGKSRKILNLYTRSLIKNNPPLPGIKLILDVDPYSFV